MYPPFPVYTAPRILDYTQSAELDAQFFFSGTPWEMVGRNYTAQTLNLANGGNLTQYDVTSKPLFPACFGNLQMPPMFFSKTPITPRRRSFWPMAADLTQYDVTVAHRSPPMQSFHVADRHCWLGVGMGHAADVAQGQRFTSHRLLCCEVASTRIPVKT